MEAEQPPSEAEYEVVGVVEKPTELRSGFTWRSLLALIYSCAIFSPAVIWLDLVQVGGGGIPVTFTTVLLFVELARISGKPLTKQEAVLIFGPATAAGSAGFLGLIHKMWFVRQAELGANFGIDAWDIPRWWGPPPNTRAWDMRTFIHPDMTLPLLFHLLEWGLGLCGSFFMALLLREMYIEGENLPFPIQRVRAGFIESVTERTQERLEVLSWAAVIAFIYAFILYTIPTVTRVSGFPISTIPIPWYDFTRSIQYILPGAALGVATDFLVFTNGFVVPTHVVMGIFVGSVLRFLVFNPLVVWLGKSGIMPNAWAGNWRPGMDLTRIFQRSTLYYWVNPAIGISFALGFIPLLFRARAVGGALKYVFKGKAAMKMGGEERISGPPASPYLMLVLFLVGYVGVFLLDIYLCPGFPIYLFAIYELIMPFVVGFAAGRLFGVTGQGFSIPHLRQLILLGGVAQGYVYKDITPGVHDPDSKIQVWFLPMELNPGTDWLRTMKLCQLTGTTVGSYLKMVLIAQPILLVVGFIYTSLFWKLAPIPSAMYPAPDVHWPIELINRAIWITRPRGYWNVPVMVYSFLIFGGLLAATRYFRLPITMVSVAAGLHMPIATSITMAIGLVIGGGILSRVFGREWYNKYRITIAAGAGLGEGIAIMLGVMTALVAKSIFSRAY